MLNRYEGRLSHARVASAQVDSNGAANGLAENYDIAIIGGGPAGLLAAKAMLAALPGSRVKVFEAAPGYRPQGAGVLIEVNGWRALHAVDAELVDRMRSRGILIRGSDYYDEKGEPLGFQVPHVDHEGNVRDHGHTAVMVHWGDIRQALYEALPEGTVSFSTRVVGLTPGQLVEGKPAMLKLQEHGPDTAGNGAEPHVRTVTAGLVVAADGYYSRSKRLAFGASGPPLLPTFRNRVIWRALVSYPEGQVPPLLRQAGDKARAVWWLADGQPPERTALVYPVNDNRFVWTCIAPAADIEAAGLPHWTPDRGSDQDLGIQQTGSAGTDPKHRCLAVFRNHPAELLDLMARTDPHVITEHGYYTHDIAATGGASDWVRGNVVLVGDAAHVGPPDGMGLNMAWEDVAVLAGEVKRRGGVSGEALDAYCQARLPRVRDVWGEPGLHKPRRKAAMLSAAFTPLDPSSRCPARTALPGSAPDVGSPQQQQGVQQ